MADALQELDRDHEDFRALLRVLEKQLESVRVGADPDLDVMEDVLECCEAYVEECHHPIEDLVHALARGDRALGGELREDYARMHALTHGLLAVVRDLFQDAIRPRETITRIGRQLVAAFCNHMQLEEARVFPAARATLSRRQWARIDALSRRVRGQWRVAPRWFDLREARQS